MLTGSVASAEVLEATLLPPLNPTLTPKLNPTPNPDPLFIHPSIYLTLSLALRLLILLSLSLPLPLPLSRPGAAARAPAARDVALPRRGGAVLLKLRCLRCGNTP